jgi:hypothetical protein
MKRCAKVLYRLGLLLAANLLVPMPALADNCSGNTDCWNTVWSCLTALGGIAGGALAPSLFGSGGGGGGDGPNVDGPQGDDGPDNPCTQ